MRNNGKYTYKLNVADADGAREKLVLESSQPIMSPAWSGDGKELAYVSFETGRPAIFRQNLVTAQRQQLTNFSGLNGAPAWSPDGSQMAMVLSRMATRKFTYWICRAINLLASPAISLLIQSPLDAGWKTPAFTSDRGGTPQIYKLNIATRATGA